MANIDPVSDFSFPIGAPPSVTRTVVVRGVGENDDVVRSGTITIEVREGATVVETHDIPVRTVQAVPPQTVVVTAVDWPGVSTQVGTPQQPAPDQPSVRQFNVIATPDPV